MTTDTVQTTTEAQEVQQPVQQPAAEEGVAPRFEQTMQAVIGVLNGLPRDGVVTNGFLMDWLLPLFEEARDEYYSMATENADQIAVLSDEVSEVADNIADEPREIDEGTRQVITAAVGLAAVAYQRAGWMDAELKITSKCPKDLSDEYTKLQKFVQAWASGVDVAALTAAVQE